MQILIVIGAVLLILSTLLLWSVVLQHDRDIQQLRRASQHVTIVAHRPHEIGEAHPFAPDAVVTYGDSVLSGREVVESSP